MSQRLLISSFTGFLLGVFCWLGGVYILNMTLSSLMVVYILLHRTAMGIMIGISGLKIKWWLNGIVIGFIFGVLFALHDAITIDMTNIPKELIILLPIIAGAFYGFIIEFVTTKLFKKALVNMES